MRPNPDYALDDIGRIRALIDDYPFVTLVSATSRGLVASHYPVMIDDGREDLALVGHVGRPDEELHELGQHEVLVIVQGAHGYVSPSWYGDRAVPAVPTWNFTVAHLYGVPELLSADENFAVLGRLVDFFEERLPEPRRMTGTPVDADYARRISGGTLGYRIPITRVEAKAKLSQDKPAHVVDRVIAALDGTGPYANPILADAMRAVR